MVRITVSLTQINQEDLVVLPFSRCYLVDYKVSPKNFMRLPRPIETYHNVRPSTIPCEIATPRSVS